MTEPEPKPKRRKRSAKMARGSAACPTCDVVTYARHLAEDHKGRCGTCRRIPEAEIAERLAAKYPCRYPGCDQPARIDGQRIFRNCPEHFDTPTH